MGHQWLGHGDFLAQQLQAVAVLRLLGAELAQLLLTLHQLLLQTSDFILQLLAPALVQGFFTGRLARRGLAQLAVDVQRAILDLGTQALDPQCQANTVSLGFADVGDETGVIQPQQRRAGFHHLAFVDVDLGDDPAFQVLDLLQLGRRNGLAVAPGDFVQHGEIGPQHHEQEETDNAPDGQPHDARCILHQGLVDLGQRLATKGLRALEIAAQDILEPPHS